MALDGLPDSGMGAVLAKQKAANLRDGIPSAETRIEWIDKTIDLLVKYGDQFNDAMAEDFGHRSKDQIGPDRYRQFNWRIEVLQKTSAYLDEARKA